MGAIDGRHLVIEAKISENLSAVRAGGVNLLATVKDPVGLVEIDGLGNVRGNNFVVFAGFGDAVHLMTELTMGPFNLPIAATSRSSFFRGSGKGWREVLTSGGG